jgi:hypothetical protein
VLSQVLVSFGEAEVTQRVIAAVQAGGVCWCGGDVATTEEDVKRRIWMIIIFDKCLVSGSITYARASIPVPRNDTSAWLFSPSCAPAGS